MFDVKKLSPAKTDIIVITTDKVLSNQELKDLLKQAKKAFPKNKVVIAPSYIDIEACDSSDLDEAIRLLQEYQQELQRK